VSLKKVSYEGRKGVFNENKANGRASMPAKKKFAINTATGEFVIIDNASKHGKYRCCDVECGAPVMVKRAYEMNGQKGPNNKTEHFAHYSTAVEERCPGKNGGETRAHYTCKHHICNNLKDYTFVKHYCTHCYTRTLYETKDCTARVEKKVPGSKKIADVLLTRTTGEPPSIVEVEHTHKVGDEKRREMEALHVPVIEVTTAAVEHAVKQPQNVWSNGQMVSRFVVKTTDFGNGICSKCETIVAHQRAIAEAVRIAERKRQQLIEDAWRERQCLIAKEASKKRIAQKEVAETLRMAAEKKAAAHKEAAETLRMAAEKKAAEKHHSSRIMLEQIETVNRMRLETKRKRDADLNEHVRQEKQLASVKKHNSWIAAQKKEAVLEYAARAQRFPNEVFPKFWMHQ
jgi:hypothetical protein